MPPTRVIVCGNDNLAYRLAYELVENGADVTVVCRPNNRDEAIIAEIGGVTLIEATHIDRELYARADLGTADALALVEQNDGRNIDAALLAREVAPHVRIVMRLFDEVLADSMRELLTNCAALSATAVATPSFVAAALGPDETRPLHIADRLLYVTERANAQPSDVVCVLSTGAAEPHVLPDSAGTDDMVLASAVTAEAAEEIDGNARGVAVARQRRIPVITADAKLEATLRAAQVPDARGLIVLTSNDVTNLEVALIGRKLAVNPRAVLRIFDAEFAARIQRAFGFAVSRSVSSLAAPSFAAAILGREVVATIAVRRRVLLVAEFAVGAGSALEGRTVAQLRRDGETEILAIRTGRGDQVLWSPPAGRKLVRTDRLIAITTRAGLGSLMARSSAYGDPQPLAVVDLAEPDLR